MEQLGTGCLGKPDCSLRVRVNKKTKHNKTKKEHNGVEELSSSPPLILNSELSYIYI